MESIALPTRPAPSARASMVGDAEMLARAIDHVFLPPKLPQQDDEDECARMLVDSALSAVHHLQERKPSHTIALSRAASSLEQLRKTHDPSMSTVDEVRFLDSLRSLKEGHTVAAKITAQNAAVLVQSVNGQLIFESFELAPSNEACMSTAGRLLRNFPAVAVAVDKKVLEDADFASTVSRTLSTMSSESARIALPQTKKAGTLHYEPRDTAHPKIVTQLFMGAFLGSLGSSVEVSAISKKTREDILWDNALAPWRRSPTWLLVRVLLQLVITRSPDGTLELYKELTTLIMTRYLDSATQHGLPDELLFIMSAKIERRLHKLNNDAQFAYIRDSLRSVRNDLAKHWRKTQEKEAPTLNLHLLSSLEFERDCLTSIPDLDRYLREMSVRGVDEKTPDYSPRSKLIILPSTKLPEPASLGSNDGDGVHTVANLQAFEQWVAQNLDRYAERYRNIESREAFLETLTSLIPRYHSLAKTTYRDHPEALSTMFLTLCELCVACDKVAIFACAMLEEYDPAVPVALLEHLLLPSCDQMRRLCNVEDYFKQRSASARFTRGDLFNARCTRSFGVRYFNGSNDLQHLFNSIKGEAEQLRNLKIAEFLGIKEMYTRLRAQYGGMTCEYRDVVKYKKGEYTETKSIHEPSCRKCSIQTQMQSLAIDIFEAPLPEHVELAKSIVFELKAPSWFVHWRDTLAYLFFDVLGGLQEKATPANSFRLANDTHLSKHYERTFSEHYDSTISSRFTLLSETKANIGTHYSSKRVGALKESDVVVQNGLQYKYYDTANCSYASCLTSLSDQVAKSCAFKLIELGPAVERFLLRWPTSPDGPAPNAVIASLGDCPESLSLSEYKALGTLPLGASIQWENILMQLAMPEIDLRKPDTTLVILQCIYRAGPPSGESDILRKAHAGFHTDKLASSMLRALETALQRVKENWQSAQALRSFAAIANRVLSLANNDFPRDSYFEFLLATRQVLFNWVELLREKAASAIEDDDRAFLETKALETALICMTTYDMTEVFLAQQFASTENTMIFVYCTITLQEREDGIKADDHHLHLLRLTCRRIMQRSYKHLPGNSHGLDTAIEKVWSAYKPGLDGWHGVAGTGEWLTTLSAASPDARSMRLHYNLLTGEFLVQGRPLRQAPQHYRMQSLYTTLFGKATVEVMPATSPKFDFSTKQKFRGFQVQLGWSSSEHDHSRLTVQACDENNNTFETLPRRLFRDIFPTHFVEEYVHWYNSSTHAIEFRPTSRPWIPTRAAGTPTTSWVLSRASHTAQWRLTKDGEAKALLCLQSTTAKTVSHVLSSLADSPQMHHVVSTGSSKPLLETDIPTLRLGFKLESGTEDLESRESRSMVVDSNQSIGTLIGLRNKLVFRSSGGHNRLVLIPESKIVQYGRDERHVAVEVTKPAATQVHMLEIDVQLGMLRDNGSSGSKLYLAYLHALSSSHLPDPLTGRTGTEQALTILSSASLRSFDRLTSDHLNIVGQIAALSPARRFYPAHLQSMQSVTWDEQLSPLSQDGRLRDEAQSIIDQMRQMEIFSPGVEFQYPQLRGTNFHLHLRDKIRSSAFKVSGSGAEDFTSSEDRPYNARDRESQSIRKMQNAIMLPAIVYQDIKPAVRFAPSCRSGHLWNLLHDMDIHQSDEKLPLQFLQYRADLTDKGALEICLSYLPSLHKWLCTTGNSVSSKFSIMMWLASLSFSEDADRYALQVLALCTRVPELAQIQAINPSVIGPGGPQVFATRQGASYQQSTVKELVENEGKDFIGSTEYGWPREEETEDEFWRRRSNAWKSAKDSAINILVNAFHRLWEDGRTDVRSVTISARAAAYVKTDSTKKMVSHMFQAWRNNEVLRQFLLKIERTVNRLHSEPPSDPIHITVKHDSTGPTSLPGFISVDHVFRDVAPMSPSFEPNPIISPGSGRKDNQDFSLLEVLLTDIGDRASSQYERAYAANLNRSLSALKLQTTPAWSDSLVPAPEILEQHVEDCRRRSQEIYGYLVTAFAGGEGDGSLHPHGPRISPLLFLRQLSWRRWSRLSEEWKACIVEYGLSITALQRAQRLVASKSSLADLRKELFNPGHTNWSVMERPEWLLVEIEHNIMIRAVQTRIAEQMIQPSSGSNAVMQLNMGEGKSSVIIPIVAAELANGSKIVRVIVDKPQSRQMAQMLISKLGGLLDRRVYYMPFTRSLKLSSADADAIARLCQECEKNGGIMLVQPAHVLSFQLMALESSISNPELSRSLLRTQDYFDSSSRNIVDESDEIFSVKFELIYTMGSQRAIEASPQRWLYIQQIMDAIRQIVPTLAHDSSIEVHYGVPGSFPRIRLLHSDVGAALLQGIAERICEFGIKGFGLTTQPEHVRKAVRRYLTQFTLDQSDIEAVEEDAFWSESTKAPLMLLRGLLAGGVLAFALGQKRWRVNYGLAQRDPPTQLAVPYRAKDCPSPRSEFSHPDAVIIMTCLTYYYGGLTEDELFVALSHLTQSDQAQDEYQLWVKDSSALPSAFHQLQGINLKDRPQFHADLYPALRSGFSVVNYFLANIVFPKEMKEFPHKIAASGWDIGASKGPQVYTTGFSGTNDNRPLLPTSVSHLDLPEQEHTNALVLQNLLAPRKEMSRGNGNGIRLQHKQANGSADILLSVTQMSPQVDVILDVGAQIIELKNRDVCQLWLEMDDRPHIKAAIYVNDDDMLSVIDRNGRDEILHISSYLTRMDACLVFLDEAHTRGIDLKLPDTYRAAVTLGPKVTKDRLIQACMRMRKLGAGQTVVFMVPDEIQIEIRTKVQQRPGDITISDVLKWSIMETHADIRRSMPLWAEQGKRFFKQEKLWQGGSADGHPTAFSPSQVGEFLEDEAQTIERRYRPQPRLQPGIAETLDTNDANQKLIADRCLEFGSLEFTQSNLQEEQERELSPEMEQERHNQKPSSVQPAKHSLHPDIMSFVMTGRLQHKESPAYLAAFKSLCNTYAAEVLDLNQLASDGCLLVSVDFAETVQKTAIGDSTDSYQRPVRWILSSCKPKSKKVERLMIISPFEANELMAVMRTATETTMHLYEPRCNSAYAPLDNLDFYTVSGRSTAPTVPRKLVAQLNLFAGQLYFSSLADWKITCGFLGLTTEAVSAAMYEQGWKVEADGFIRSDGQQRVGGASGLTTSPVPFLRHLMSTIRRDGEAITKTHMGSLLDGRIFEETDFQN